MDVSGAGPNALEETGETRVTGAQPAEATLPVGPVRLLALGSGGAAVLFYLVGFVGGFPFSEALPVALVLGGGLTAAAAVLPRAGRLLLPATVVAVVGFLVALLTLSGSPGALGIVALVLGFLAAAAPVGAVLLDTGLVNLPAPRTAATSQGRFGAPSPGGYAQQPQGQQFQGQQPQGPGGFGQPGPGGGGYLQQPGYPPYGAGQPPYGPYGPAGHPAPPHPGGAQAGPYAPGQPPFGQPAYAGTAQAAAHAGPAPLGGQPVISAQPNPAQPNPGQAGPAPLGQPPAAQGPQQSGPVPPRATAETAAGRPGEHGAPLTDPSGQPPMPPAAVVPPQAAGPAQEAPGQGEAAVSGRHQRPDADAAGSGPESIDRTAVLRSGKGDEQRG